MFDWNYVKILLFFLFILVVITGFFTLYDAYYDCPKRQCFNRDGELWCELGCWRTMERFNTIPSLDSVPIESTTTF
jgi:hypothetical protein